MNKKSVYLPNCSTCYTLQENKIRSYAPDGTYTDLPNPAADRIVVNNIAWQEFDYTENLTNDGQDILPDDEIEGNRKN